MTGPLRIGNASGFYGDRFDAVREMLTDGPLDVLTGDYLAELTLLILGRSRLKDPKRGYASTFLRQMEENLHLAHERGVKIVTNAGGLNPAGLADAVRALADRLAVPVRVAHVEGDGLPVPEGYLTANAYLGGAGIAACLRAGADIVVTGRVTDAALVTGPAAAHFGWGPGDLDALAGAVVAGHVLECGTQATGGNYAFFGEHDVRRPGFPLAEIHADGSGVVTKHDGTGGVVDLGTVTAQLLYETAGARYAGPDVTARLDTVHLTQDGPDRVRITGVRGEAPPPTLKTGLNRLGGWRNEVVFVLTGLDIEAKSRLVRDQFEDALARAGRAPAEVRWELARTDRPDAPTEETGSALLRLVVRDQDAEAVGRAVSGAAVELALGSYPGFHVTAPPGKGAPYGVFEAGSLPAEEAAHVAVLPDGRKESVPAAGRYRELEPVVPPPLPPPLPAGPTRTAPLGLIAGARSGDKGGDANVGLWVRSEDAWRWLAHELTVERFQELLPETARLTVVRHVLPNLRALNFVVHGLLGEGVAAQARFDPQAKAVGEWLRSRCLPVPVSLLDPPEVPA
ncbi:MULTISPECIES: acyclic terpene utilization AtuA family protein [unclassified Streptomyces]|nr:MULTISPECIES: acyclic terpene utilization AtuA family protein [unclassified Streptomyces]MYR66548.1 acyclic terpene utilization AtuA family protein [Streptomyces sp. SID4939]MYR99583.1 acyclic terpene utilization AtuA family protein [Streptomyces sp. SID4940]MYT61816.1 acyclic terpene utilization AtuA family protein [Streptomyces sp. SID8357]MYT85186.1 acyclic terpene utilization AtuA family protein [Streptomyces sp. SID8360]MYW39119.1 acyclic terpene utilization AtuA family protein [Strept